MEMVGEAKFTPGPWKVQPGEISIGPYNKGLMVGPLQYAKVHVVGPFEAPLDDETRANARLIAAAPDLLAAAEAQKAADSEHANCKCWSEVGPCTKCGARFEEARELLYAAITRATTP